MDGMKKEEGRKEELSSMNALFAYFFFIAYWSYIGIAWSNKH